MARQSTHFIFAVLTASCAFAQPVTPSIVAQPVISSEEVVNSASYLLQGMPGSGIAQGSIFTIFGSGLGPGTMVQAGPLPLQTSLGGTSVTVTYNNQTSAPEPVQIVPASFATYTFSSGGYGQAIATDLNYQVNTIINTLHPGDYVILWGTGLGAIDGDDSIAPPVGNLGSPTVHVGNASLAPYYAGRSYSYPGLDQVIFQITAVQDRTGRDGRSLKAGWLWDGV